MFSGHAASCADTQTPYTEIHGMRRVPRIHQWEPYWQWDHVPVVGKKTKTIQRKSRLDKTKVWNLYNLM